MCLQVEPSSPPATVPPSPSIIHGGCQTSRTRPQFFFACLPKLRMNLLFAKNIPLISQDFFAASFGGIQLDEIWELRE